MAQKSPIIVPAYLGSQNCHISAPELCFLNRAQTQLFVAGYVSSGVFGLLVGAAADRWGRRRSCCAFGLLYVTASLLIQVNHFGVLLLGRVLSGIATSLLFSVFDSWMVAEHNARNDDGAPRDAVVSLWVADAGWWEIAEEDHPSPDDFFKLPGRRASAGDSAHPVGYGAEEGRRLDTTLEWNGRRLPGTTFRHAWGHTSELLRFDLEGTFGDIARRMARDAGLAGAEVCSDTERSLGRVRVKVRGAPWDMAAARIGAVTETTPLLIGRVLHFDNHGFGGQLCILFILCG